MREIGVLEAKTHFSRLVDEVGRGGEEVVVTRHGEPLVRLTPTVRRGRLPPAEVADLFRQVREAARRQWSDEPEFDWRAAIEEGRY